MINYSVKELFEQLNENSFFLEKRKSVINSFRGKTIGFYTELQTLVAHISISVLNVIKLNYNENKDLCDKINSVTKEKNGNSMYALSLVCRVFNIKEVKELFETSGYNVDANNNKHDIIGTPFIEKKAKRLIEVYNEYIEKLSVEFKKKNKEYVTRSCKINDNDLKAISNNNPKKKADESAIPAKKDVKEKNDSIKVIETATYYKQDVCYTDDSIDYQVEDIEYEYDLAETTCECDDSGNIRILQFEGIDISGTNLSDMIKSDIFSILIVLPDQFPNVAPEGFYYPMLPSLTKKEGNIIKSKFKDSDGFNKNDMNFDDCGPLLHFWPKEKIKYFWHKIKFNTKDDKLLDGIFKKAINFIKS